MRTQEPCSKSKALLIRIILKVDDLGDQVGSGFHRHIPVGEAVFALRLVYLSIFEMSLFRSCSFEPKVFSWLESEAFRSPSVLRLTKPGLACGVIIAETPSLEVAKIAGGIPSF
jgi:hypothetical protein